jgi:L-ascorbate metabolism protein UlaG (beta-lactamase superfamily)
MLASPLWKGDRFENTVPVPSPVPPGKMLSTAGEYFFGSSGVQRRPPVVLPVESPLEAWARPASSGLRATWLGHSTVLLELDGVRVLTDPVWGERVSPVAFAGPRRFHPAPVALGQLPPLDAIVVSHDHFDHLDYPTIRALARTGTPFVTSLGVGAHLEAWGVPPETITELDWWQTATVGRATFHATPARHFSGRGFGTTNGTLWSSWVIESDRRRVFFSGDTGLTDAFVTIGQRLGPFDLVMLEVGAFHPAWGSIHLGPDNALKAHAMLGGGTLLPVHWGTFDLALHAWDDPAEALAAHATRTALHLVTPRPGRAVEPAHVDRFDPWWRAHRRARAAIAESAEPIEG